MPEPRLEVIDTLGHRVIRITKTPFGIGRTEANGVRLAGSQVSRDHAEITQTDDGKYIIRDLGSRYGTYVNGERITERVLVEGDRVRLGAANFGAELVFFIHDLNFPIR